MPRFMIRPAMLGLVLVALNVAAPVATAQTLADAIPATCVFYFRSDDPIGRFEKLTGNGEIWSNPKKVSARTKDAMGKAMKQADKHVEKDEGTVDAWLRSIGAVEVALFSLSFDRESGDFMPQVDFAAAFESPAAIEMFNTMGKMLVDQGQATRNERGDLVIGMPFGGMAPLLSVQGNKVVLASSEDRLASISAAFKSGKLANPLSADPTFRACIGESSSPTVIFARFGALLQLVRDNIPERAQKRMTEIVTPLGLMKVVGMGYHEEGSNSVFVAKGSEPIAAFKLLKGKSGPPGILEKMPADSAFTLGRTEELGPHLQRIQKFLLDPATFPFSKEVGEGIDSLASTTGLRLDQIFSYLKGAVVFAGVPDETGKFDEQRSLVAVAKIATREEALAIMSQMQAGMKSSGQEMEQSEADGLIWLKPGKAESQPAETAQGGTGGKGAGAGAVAPPPPLAGGTEVRVGEGGVEVRVGGGAETQPTDAARAERQARIAARRAARRSQAERDKLRPIAVWSGEVMIAGGETAVMRTLAAQRGQAPTLATTGALKRLPGQATFYTTSSFRSMFSQENDFSAALSLLKDFGNVGSSITVEDDMITVIGNRTAAEQVGTIIAAAAVGEAGRDERSEIIDQLREIGERTKAFREKNKKWPASLAELGYTEKDMPGARDSEGKMQAIVFLPPKEGASPDDYQGLLAYYPSADFGRLAVSLSGAAWSWSESDFIGALARYNSPGK